MAKRNVADEIAEGCLMGRARVVTRVLTGIYDEALRPFGIKGSQLNLLVVAVKMGPVRRAEIGNSIFRPQASFVLGLSLAGVFLA